MQRKGMGVNKNNNEQVSISKVKDTKSRLSPNFVKTDR